MNIAEMHVWFRQYAQQMGMQNVRAILPEQIDILINTSISDVVNQLIRENIGVVNDRVVTDNAKLNQINALKSLYKVAIIDMVPPTPTLSEETRTFNFSASDKLTGKMTTDFVGIGGHKGSDKIPSNLFLVDFALNYKVTTNGYTGVDDTITGITYSVKSPTSAISGGADYIYENINADDSVKLEVYDVVNDAYKLISCIYDGDSNLVYEDDSSYIIYVCNKLSGNTVAPYYVLSNSELDPTDYGDIVNPLTHTNYSVVVNYVKPDFSPNAVVTNFFPVRIINDSFLADTLNDFVLKNRLRTPIIVTYNNGTFDLYIDEFIQTNGRYHLRNMLVPYQLRMSYISRPAVVKYDEDLVGNSVDCDLPESLHVDILKHAVDLYTTSIQGSLYSAQQQQQMQNRETSRNEARPDNEGYQN